MIYYNGKGPELCFLLGGCPFLYQSIYCSHILLYSQQRLRRLHLLYDLHCHSIGYSVSEGNPAIHKGTTPLSSKINSKPFKPFNFATCGCQVQLHCIHIPLTHSQHRVQ